MARFSEAILNEIRNRELLAQALAEQQREQMRRRAIFRGILAALPLAISMYLLSNEPLPEFEALEKLKAVFGGKQILKQMESQIEKSDQVLIAAKQKASAPENYAHEELPDEILSQLEARQQALAEFTAKMPKKTLSEEQVLRMAERAESGQVSAELATGADLTTMASERMKRLEEAENLAGQTPSARAPASTRVASDERYEMIPDEELLRRVPESALRSATSAPYRFAEAADLERIAVPLASAAPAEYLRGLCVDEGC